MTRTYFGTDGIRGEANEGNMTPEVAFRLGAAVTYQARKKVTHAPRIVIGKDTRISGYLFEHAVSAGVCTMGGRVMLTGPLPTPAVAHLTTSMRADAGVMISASHNPYQDNGLKVFGKDGFKLPDDQEEELERLMHSDELNHGRPRGTQVGRAERIETAWGRYVQFIKGAFPSELTLDGIKIVVDAAHGAAYQTAPHVFYELGATITSIGVKPNGQNINFERGAMYPQHCARQVLRRGAHVGFALDGDADRVVVIDEKGRQVNGDAVMALCATRMIKRNSLKQRTLVTTVMSSIGLDHALLRHSGTVLRVDVGDRYVVEAMRKQNLNFGGEQSGHLIFLDHSSTGDGTLGALQLLAIMLREQRPLSELVDEVFEAVPQVLVNVALPERRPLIEMARTRKVIEHAERSLGNDGRVLVRWSGTEPKLRVMVEGPNEIAIRNLADSIADAATQELRPG
jgi:phosphoglucosamine mutase